METVGSPCSTLCSVARVTKALWDMIAVGMRRRSRIDEPTEYYGLLRALESVDRADQKYVPSASEGVAAEPLAPFAIPEELLNAAIGSPLAVHVAFAHTRKSIRPVSEASGSVSLAVSVGVAVVRTAPFEGLTRFGTLGAVSVTLVNERVDAFRKRRHQDACKPACRQ